MKTYNRFLEFAGKNYRNFIFVAVFYSLWLVYKYTSAFDPELQSFSGRMIGEATLQGYDINQRIKIFYQTGILFLVSLIVISIISWQLSSRIKDFFKGPEIQFINYTSLAGIILYFFILWGAKLQSSLELIYSIQKGVLILYLVKKLLLKNVKNTEQININFYTIAFVLGVSVFFIWNETATLLGFSTKPDLLLSLFLFVILSSILTIQYIKRFDFLEAKQYLNRIAYLLVPLTIIPFLSFVKDESYLILNKHQIYFFSPGLIYFIALVTICFWIILRYFRIRKDKSLGLERNTNKLIATRYFPLLVLSFATTAFYNPFIQGSTEMFEAGNRFLPIMEFQKFGVIPIFEKFNSHALSELFYGSIYTFFNGLHGREILIYDFMSQVVWALIVYWFIYKLSRNAYVALFSILLFPLIESLLSDYVIIAVIGIFILNKVISQAPSFKNYFLLIVCAVFLVMWRIDIGYPAVVAIIGTLIIYYINREQFLLDRKMLLKAVVVFLVPAITILFAISWWRNMNVFSKMLNAINYLASAQTYGLVNFGDPARTEFKIQYFVFPIIMIVGILFILIYFKRYTVSRSQRFIYTSFLFLAIFYFVNFQRGLVRHSFMEGHDNALSSFAFFIFSASIYLFFHAKSQLFKFLTFITVSVFLVMNYKYPQPSVFQNVYAQMIEKTDQYTALKPVENIQRCIGSGNYEHSKFANFKQMIAQQLTDKQTFIDFSNTPMLYYFTEKISPSYFYQNPLTIHNDYLQKSFISDLSKYDVPFIVFSNFPETWWDNVDGVPNTVRHYRMAEYFFTNYKPFTVIDSLCIWKRNDFNCKNNEHLVYSYASSTDSLHQKNNISGNVKASTKSCLFKVSSATFKDKNDQSFTIRINMDGEEKKLVPSFVDEINHLGYYILSPQQKAFSFQLKNEDRKIHFLNVYECDFIPDFYSYQPKRFDLKQLPYIWATYDKTVHQEKELANLLVQPQALPPNTIQYFNFSSGIDKSSGNSLLISLDCENEKPATLELLYGSSKSGYKGTFAFSVLSGQGMREFAVRISSQYNWYDSDVDYVALNYKDSTSIKLTSIKLLKGN